MRKRPSKAINPFALAPWTTLGWQATEMMLASAQVMQHRLGRMQSSTFPLSPTDSTEFLRMGQEKAQAMTESLVAVSLGVMGSDSPATLTSKAMRPFRVRAMANAKRLARIKP